MKIKHKIATSLTMVTLATGAFATGETRVNVPQLQTVPVKHVFAPEGFDDNDESQVVVTGYLPNLCYKAPRANTVVSNKTVDVTISALKEQAPGTMCLQAIVPYMEVVSLGVLDKGMYDVKVNRATNTPGLADLKVTAAPSSAIDDFIYAAVDNVEVIPGTRTATLRGFNPSDCFALDEVKMVSNNKDTFSVLPILKQVHQVCPMKLVPFEYRVEVPQGELNAESILLHVRVMNGKSVNAVFDNR